MIPGSSVNPTLRPTSRLELESIYMFRGRGDVHMNPQVVTCWELSPSVLSVAASSRQLDLLLVLFLVLKK